MVSFISFSNSWAAENSPCDEKAESKVERTVRECQLRPKKAQKLWKDLPTAQREVLKAIEVSDVAALLPYVGCDASDSSRLEIVCESDMQPIGEEAIKLAISRARVLPITLTQSKWVRYGAENDIFVLCGKTNFKAAKNPCGGNGDNQPVIEVRSSSRGYYIFGVPLSGKN